MSDETGAIDGLMLRLLAADMADTRALLESHGAVLLSDQAEAWLEAEAAAADDDADRRQALAWHLGLIQACRQNGIHAVFRQVEQQQTAARDPVQEALDELRALKGNEPETLLRKVEICEQLIEAVERDLQPDLWAELHFRLGAALQAFGQYRGEARFLVGAVETYLTAIREYTRERRPAEWKATQYQLKIAFASIGDIRGDAEFFLEEENSYLYSYQLDRIMKGFTEASADSKRTAIEAEPAVLTSTAAVVWLKEWIQKAGDRTEFRVQLEQHLELIQECREHGIDEVFAHLARQSFPEKRIRETLTELRSLKGKDLGTLNRKLNICRQITNVITPANNVELWVELNTTIGLTLLIISDKPDADENVLLQEAAKAFRCALLDKTSHKNLSHWYITQGFLGVVLTKLGEKLQDLDILNQAVDAWKTAAPGIVDIQEESGKAAAYGNFGHALTAMGKQSGNPALLIEGVEAYRTGLSHISRDKDPLWWAAAQNNVGAALMLLLNRGGEIDTLTAAEKAFRAALLEQKRENDPLGWASTVSNLGVVLQRRGKMQDDLSLVKESVELFHLALLEQTRENDPEKWAASLLNLGTGLSHIELKSPDYNTLKNAVVCYKRALDEVTPHKSFVNWARIEANLASCLQRLSVSFGEPGALDEAFEVIRTVCSPEVRRRSPLDWAYNQNTLGAMLSLLGRLSSNPELLARAVEASEAAWMEQTRDRDPRGWAATHNVVGNTRAALGKMTGRKEVLSEALDNFHSACTIITVQNEPQTYLQICKDCGKILMYLGRYAEAEREFEALLENAAEAVNAATSTAEQITFLKIIAGVGDALALALIEQGKLEKAFHGAGRGRAVVLASTQAANRRAGDASQALRAARNEWRNACRLPDAADTSMLVAEVVNAVSLEESAVRRRHATEAVRAAYERYRDLLREAGFERVEVPSASVIAGVLPPGSALALLILGEVGAAVLFLRQHSDGQTCAPPLVEILELPDLTSDAVSALLFRAPSGAAGPTPWFVGYSDFLRALEQGNGAATFAASEAWNSVAEGVLATLWELLMRPLRDRLQGMGLAPGDEVVLCLPGRLAALPLHAAGERVPAADGSGRTTWRCFLDDFAVSYVPSPQALVDARTRADQPARQGAALLAVTNPTADTRIAIAANPAWAAFPAERRKELRHAAATIAAVTAELGPEGRGWSHLSLYCHGSFNPVDPDNTGLAMAGGAFLTVRHLRGLDLPTARLAFLGACESGMIGLDLADEQVGLPASLLEAGIPAVAASHWPVSAQATRLLAEAFFGLMLQRGLRPAQALRLAQLGMRDAALMSAQGCNASVTQAAEALLRGKPADDDGNDQPRTTTEPPPPAPLHDPTPDPRHADPIYWAAFSLTGA